jgi:hypothetical protein
MYIGGLTPIFNGVEAQRMANYLQAREEQGLLKYETGRR